MNPNAKLVIIVIICVVGAAFLLGSIATYVDELPGDKLCKRLGYEGLTDLDRKSSQIECDNDKMFKVSYNTTTDKWGKEYPVYGVWVIDEEELEDKEQ